MSQRDTDKARVADRRSEETGSFVRQVRAATRRKYTPEEKIRICWQPAKVGLRKSPQCLPNSGLTHNGIDWTSATAI